MNDDSARAERERAYNEGRVATTDGRTPQSFDSPAPGPVTASGQHEQYWVLSESERAKGFVRPVRRAYRHVGIAGPANQLRDLTEQERELWGDSFAKYELYYPLSETSSTPAGRFWTQEQLDKIGKGCGTVTTMGVALAETYARDPGFYGSTFCCGCRTHIRVGSDGEFEWEGTTERVGT